jgi:hypothetical protein
MCAIERSTRTELMDGTLVFVWQRVNPMVGQFAAKR